MNPVYRHIKTGNYYRVLGTATNKTSGPEDGRAMVRYEPIGSKVARARGVEPFLDLKCEYVREADEFHEKFRPADSLDVDEAGRVVILSVRLQWTQTAGVYGGEITGLDGSTILKVVQKGWCAKKRVVLFLMIWLAEHGYSPEEASEMTAGYWDNPIFDAKSASENRTENRDDRA